MLKLSHEKINTPQHLVIVPPPKVFAELLFPRAAVTEELFRNNSE